MKKNKVKEVVIMVLAFGAFLLLFGRIGYHETHYTMTGVVKTVHGSEVTVETEDGHRWGFYGTGYTINDNVELTMWNGGTDLEKNDDEVENVKKIS